MNYREIKEVLENAEHKDYVKAVLSFELHTDDEKKLDYLYDEYMENDDIQLVDEFFYDEELNFDNKKSEVSIDVL